MKFRIRTINILLLLAGLFLPLSTFAQDVEIKLEKQLISLMDRTTLQVIFTDTRGDAPVIPHIEGLDIRYRGPTSQTQMINWKSTSKLIHTYVITPAKTGDFKIGPIECVYKGGKKTLNAQLRVIKANGDKEAQEISDVLFSRIETKTEKPFVHEPFTLELFVHVKEGIQVTGNLGFRGGIPEQGLDGEPEWEMVDRTRKEINGTIFTVYKLTGRVETLTAGTFSFEPQVQVNLVVPRQRRRSSGYGDPFFDDFFGRQETRSYVLDCNRLDVEVQPIPLERRPESYTGGIGKFNFEAEVGPETVKAGEPITVKMRIYGVGNISQITAPDVQGNDDIKLYDSRSIPTASHNEIRFEQVVIPRSENVTEIPAISFSYFNTQTADYRTITRGPFPVTVQPSGTGGAQILSVVPTGSDRKTKVLGKDIIYLKPMPQKWHLANRPVWYTSTLFHTLLILPAVLAGLAFVITRNRDALETDVARARRQKAPKSARRNIQEAERALRKKDAGTFYEALWKTLSEYFGNRLNLSPGEVSLQTLLPHLPKNATDVSETIREIFTTIEHHRYGLGAPERDAQKEMKELLSRTGRVLKQCERMKL